MLGRGYGSGSPWLIPAAPTDMLFAASAEEIGLAGSLGVIAVYFLLIGHVYACAMRGRSPRRQLAAVGAANILAVQSFVIIGGNLGVLPLTGVTLPFASYGGSSMISSLALAGILLGSTTGCESTAAEAAVTGAGAAGASAHDDHGNGSGNGGGDGP
jgi:cell division protein FtsW (lipid II flippase)